MNISGLFRIRFVRHYEGYILREFHFFAFKSQQKASEKRPFSVFFIFFFWTNKSILMFHVSFCRYFESYIFIPNFFYIINIFRFISEKHAFCNYSIFFAYFLHKSWVSNVRIFSDGLSRLSWKEMLVYNFFPVKFYFY